ncbi:unnamed protein product, partial [Amoebophrya sp. A25]
CYEAKLVSADFLCGHQFCIGCAANCRFHTSSSGLTCPLCRKEVVGCEEGTGLEAYARCPVAIPEELSVK